MKKNNVNYNIGIHFSSKVDKNIPYITNHGKIISVMKEIKDNYYDSDEDDMNDIVLD